MPITSSDKYKSKSMDGLSERMTKSSTDDNSGSINLSSSLDNINNKPLNSPLTSKEVYLLSQLKVNNQSSFFSMLGSVQKLIPIDILNNLKSNSLLVEVQSLSNNHKNSNFLLSDLNSVLSIDSLNVKSTKQNQNTINKLKETSETVEVKKVFYIDNIDKETDISSFINKVETAISFENLSKTHSQLLSKFKSAVYSIIFINTINRASKHEFSLKQVSTHNQPSDFWLIINNNVYDITTFIKKHPGSIIFNFRRKISF